MSAHLERLLRIYNRLRRGPVTVEIVSAWARSANIKVSDRQLYRDLNQLKSLQIAEGENVIEYIDEKNRKTWKIEFVEFSEILTHYDINSFFLLKNFAPNAIVKERKPSIEKLENILYKSLSKSKYEQSIQANELYLRKTNYNENILGNVEQQQIEDMIWALHNHRIVIIEKDDINPTNIHSIESIFPLTLYPLELVFHRGRVHIAGLSTSNKLMIFAIDKELVFKLTNDRFNRKKLLNIYKKQFEVLFGITEPINDKIYTIKLEFTNAYARVIKSFHWHHSEKWSLLKNGNYMLELNTTIGRELVGFIAIGLDKIKVHQPKVLKDLMIKKLKQTVHILEKDLSITEEEANKDY